MTSNDEVIFRYHQYPLKPWKNGNGKTREVLVKDNHDHQQALKISIAEIDKNCDFSIFAGQNRIIVALSGPQVTLRFEDGEQVDLKTMEPYSFSGNRVVSSALKGEGTAQDFNVIYSPDVFQVNLRIETLTDLISAKTKIYPDSILESKEARLIYIAKGQLQGTTGGNNLVALEAGDGCLLLPENSQLKFDLTHFKLGTELIIVEMLSYSR